MKTKAISSFFVLFAIASVIATSAPDAFADHAEVTIVTSDDSGFNLECAENCYSPSTATVDVGGVVTFSNPVGIHTFTAGTVENNVGTPTGEFDTSIINAGESVEWIPETAGEVPYYCTLHPWMLGTIIVQEVEAEEEADQAEVHSDDEPMMVKSLTDEYKMNNEATTTGMLSDGTMVSIWATTVTANEFFEVAVEFADAEHVNYDIMVTQQGGEYMNDEGAHAHDGKGTHVSAPLSSSNAVDITITFQGYGVDDPKTGPIGEQVVFTEVVPEFGTIAMMILAVAIISIVAVTAKSRVVPRF